MGITAVASFRGRTIFLVLAVSGILFLAAATSAEQAPSAPGSAAPAGGTRSLILGEGQTLWEIFLRGGWCMWPILASSVIGMVFFMERAIELRRKKHAPSGFDKDLVHVVDTRGVDAGLAICLERQSSLSRVLYAALLRYGTSRQEMEAAVQDEGTRLLYDLRRNCRMIGIMANQAPLWGLLGTVLGLIQAFDQVAAGGALGKTERLADGVAVALLTTAFGLIVAIPLTFLYQYEKGKADDIVREIEERAVDAIVTLDRKARRSIRRIEDIEENLETKEMAAAKPVPDLDAEFNDADLEKSIKTSVTTPAHVPVVSPGSAAPAAEGVPSGEAKRNFETAHPPRLIVPPQPEPRQP